MWLELVATILGSQIVRAVGTEMIATLACQGAQQLARSAVRRRDVPKQTDTDRDLRRELRLVPVSEPTTTVETISSIPGRVRLRVEGLLGNDSRAGEIEERLGRVPGVERVEANALTGKVLVRFDPDTVGPRRIVATIQTRPASARVRRAPRRAAPALRLVARAV